MLRALFAIFGVLAIGCTSEKEGDATCEALCTALVQDCAFAAYPSESSCTQGCLYNQEQGADVGGMLECVEAADECDAFAIAECEHAHGS